MKNIPFTDDHKETLLAIPLFRDLPPYVKDKLVEKLCFHLYEIPANEIVATQGEACRKLYVLLQGKLEVNIIDANGNEVLIEHIVAPRTFATPHLFQEDNRFPATFRVMEDAVLFTATKDSAFRLISECPDILRSFLKVTGNCNACTTRRLDILSRKTIQERLLTYLLQKRRGNDSRVHVMHTLTQLAEYLNVSRPALSTEFNRLEKEGWIKRVDKNWVELNLSLLRGKV